MSNTIADYPTANSINAASDYFLIEQSSAYKKITLNTITGLSGSLVGTTDSQTLTNKVLGNTNTFTAKDTLFTLQDDGDVTKQATFQLSGITTGNTRVMTLPDANATLVGTATTQTLTNKTLTSPTITGGTIDNSTVTVDSIAGHTSASTGTVYGISVTSGTIGSAALAANAVTTTAINNAAVTASKLSTGAQTAVVLTNESTSSTSYTDLATPGPAVTVTIGANGLALVILSCAMSNNTNGDYAVMGFAASGANTIAASNDRSLYVKEASTADRASSWAYLATGLSSGSTTFTAKYEVITGGTASFTRRYITVIPL